VFNPGPAAWRDGLHIADVIGSVDDLRPNADINYILIRRELPPDRRAVMLSADLAAALREPNSPKNVALMPRDRLIVFDTEAGRAQLLNPILDEMRRQSRIDLPSEIVRIDGRVKARGDYPLSRTCTSATCCARVAGCRTRRRRQGRAHALPDHRRRAHHAAGGS
jgi:hypothetical protein